MLYYIGARGPDGALLAVKIGRTGGNPAVRMGGLQAGFPFRLELLATMPGCVKEEREHHQRWAHRRLRYEWFEPAADLLASLSATAVAAAGPARPVPIETERLCSAVPLEPPARTLADRIASETISRCLYPYAKSARRV